MDDDGNNKIEELNNLIIERQTNDLTISSALDENLKLKKENSRIDNILSNLYLRKKKVKNILSTIKKTKRRGIAVSVLLALLIAILTALVLLIVNVNLTSSSIFVIIGFMQVTLVPIISKISLDEYFKQKEYLKNNSISDIENDINLNCNRKNLNFDKLNSNLEEISELNANQDELNDKIEIILSELSKYPEFKDIVIKTFVEDESVLSSNKVKVKK